MAIPTINFKGFLYDDAGDAVSGATINLYAKNATTTSLATDTTDSNGAWDINYTTAGTAGLDIQITSGSSKRRIKYDDKIHLAEVDTALLNIRATNGNPAAMYFFADEGADAGDRWEIKTVDSTGLLTIGNDKQSQDTYVAHVTITPHATVASSTFAIAGLATIAGKLTLSDGFAVGSDANGDVLYSNGTKYVRLARGSDGDVLTLASSIPSWATPTTGDITSVSLTGDSGGALNVASGAAEFTLTGGAGIDTAGSSTTITFTLDLNELTDTAIAHGDYIIFTDTTDSNATVKGDLADVATLFAGAGMTATSSVLNVIGGDGITANSNDVAITAAQTTVTSVYNASLKMGRDSQNLIDFATTDNKIILRVNNVDEVELVADTLSPVTSDGVALGTGSLMWSDLFLASGSVINLNNGDITLTHSSNTLTVAGGTFATAALTTSTIVASGIIKTDDNTNATSTTDGSLQTDGGLSVVLDAVFGDDVTLITDGAVLNLGIGSDVSITHDGTTGGTITGTPMVYQSKGAAALGNDTHSGIVLEMLAGESLAVGDWVYADSTDGRVSKADANDTGDNGHYPTIGVAVSAQGSAGSVVNILTHGTYNDSDGFGGDLTEGNLLYLSETAGGVTATAPSDDGDMVQVVGVAIGPRDVFVNPSLVVVEVA